MSSQKQIPEEEIVALLLKKSTQGFNFLYDQYSAMLYGVIKRIVRDDRYAEEVLKECFISAGNNIGQYNPAKDRLSAWMMHIARRFAFTRLHSMKDPVMAKYGNIENLLAESIVNEQIRYHPGLKKESDIIRNMDQEHRHILYLLFYSGLNQSEASLKMNIPLGTVKARTRAAIFKLRNSRSTGYL